MDVNIIILIVFGVLFIVFVGVASYLMRNSTLEKLPLLPDEEVLFEEEGVRVDTMLRGEGIKTIYPKNRIRVTNKRIITAQTPWFGKRTFLRHVINYVEKGPELATQGAGVFLKNPTILRGYLTLYTSKNRIAVENIQGKQVVKISASIKEAGFLSEPRIFIYTKDVLNFKHILE